MRTYDQIQSKINELKILLNRSESTNQVTLYTVCDSQIEILEWVLNQPTGNYHK
jgi:hypothetical protein